jgi:hypothetical protein
MFEPGREGDAAQRPLALRAAEPTLCRRRRRSVSSALTMCGLFFGARGLADAMDDTPPHAAGGSTHDDMRPFAACASAPRRQVPRLK